MVPWIKQKYHRPNSLPRSPNQRSIHQKRTSGCSPFWPGKSLWHILTIWHTQRPWLTRQTPHFHKILPRRPDLPNMNKQYTLCSKIGILLSVILFMIKINKISTCSPPQKSTDHYMLMTFSFVTAPKIWLP